MAHGVEHGSPGGRLRVGLDRARLGYLGLPSPTRSNTVHTTAGKQRPRVDRPPAGGRAVLAVALAHRAGLFVWLTGLSGPVAGRVADRRGWRFVALAGLAFATAGIALSVLGVLVFVLVGMALNTFGNFAGVTAAQLGVAGSTQCDRGLARAL